MVNGWLDGGEGGGGLTIHGSDEINAIKTIEDGLVLRVYFRLPLFVQVERGDVDLLVVLDCRVLVEVHLLHGYHLRNREDW
jgi:hypothetical protein